MKKAIILCLTVLFSSALFYSCEEVPCYDLALVGTWMAPGGSTYYTFTEENIFDKVRKSTSGYVVETTTYPGYWEVSGANTLIFDFKDSSKSSESRLYEFVDGIDTLTSLEASDDAYTNALRWATDAEYTADDTILLFADPDEFADFGWNDIYRLH